MKETRVGETPTYEKVGFGIGVAVGILAAIGVALLTKNDIKAVHIGMTIATFIIGEVVFGLAGPLIADGLCE